MESSALPRRPGGLCRHRGSQCATLWAGHPSPVLPQRPSCLRVADMGQRLWPSKFRHLSASVSPSVHQEALPAPLVVTKWPVAAASHPGGHRAAQGTEGRGPGAPPALGRRGWGLGVGPAPRRPPGGSFCSRSSPGQLLPRAHAGLEARARGQECPSRPQGFWQVGHKSVLKLGGSPGGPRGRGAPGTYPALTGPLQPQLL